MQDSWDIFFKGFPTIESLDHEYGKCVLVRMPPDNSDDVLVKSLSHLKQTFPQAFDFLQNTTAIRRRTWLGGRIALARAAGELDYELEPVMADDNGLPLLPKELAGSISHKNDLAGALVAKDEGWSLGFDLEVIDRSREIIARRVLTPDEMTVIEKIPAEKRWPQILLRFSLKEAVYKALYPMLKRVLSFQEVTICLNDATKVSVELQLKNAEGPLEVEANYFLKDKLIYSFARGRSIIG